MYSKMRYGTWIREDEEMHENILRSAGSNCDSDEEQCDEFAGYLQGWNDAKYVAQKCEDNSIHEGCEPVDMFEFGN